MIKWLLKKALGRFARQYDYNINYMFDMEQHMGGTLWRYALMQPFAQHRGIASAEAYYLAKVVAVKQADCGPCLRLVCNMAREAGVPAERLAHVLRGTPDQLPAPLRSVVSLADAAVAGDALAAEEHRRKVVETYGEGAAAEIALAVAFGGFYPNLKRALGEAAACEPILKELEADLLAAQPAS